ncbi:MAG: hypothetical protein ACI8WM_000423 [Burkholderiaceae bacterium]|jgi:hypothetical protein
MKKFSVALLLLTATMAVQSAELPPLDATVTYDSKFVSHAGVTEIRQFSNILIRRPGHVWMERILPAQAQEHAEAHAGHKHFDFETSTQHLTRTATGAIRAEYVDRGERRVVFVPPTEYSVSGFDGSWDNAAAMVSEKTVKAMPLSKRATTVADTEWREESRNGWYNRVLWSNRQQVALIVESGKTDGSTTRRTVLALRPMTVDAALPWKQLGAYAQMEYDDFMD